MTGMHSEKFKFACPLCHAGPRKPCVEIKGPQERQDLQSPPGPLGQVQAGDNAERSDQGGMVESFRIESR